jgi:2-oxoglutarate dehydrogenase E2 component (dihydrolipoamide succinyltransferase)
MTTRVFVPLLGEGVDEVTVSRWLKREGDSIKELEPLLEVNTDKVDTEIPSPASGTVLKIMAQEGAAAKVGETLALIGQPGEAIDTADTTPVTRYGSARPAPTAPTVAQPTAPRLPGSVGFIAPVVRRMAAEHGVDLTEVPGTGLNGRITKNDVLNFIAAGAPSPKARSTEGRAPAPRRLAGDQLIPHTTIRRQIAEHMLLSHRTSPHVLTVMEADMGRVAAHRDGRRADFEGRGVKLTFTAYLIAAIAAALKDYPTANSSWTDEGILLHGAINVGMATSLGEEGLIVPVIKSADQLSLLDMARAVNDLAARARAHKLRPDEVRGGTFTLTNHGIGGSLLAMPIINQPQCGILGTGAIQKRVVAVTDGAGRDAFAVRPMLYLSLVFDHRILDGASADAFLQRVKYALENWD